MEKHHLFILLSHHLYAGASCNSMLARQHLKKYIKKRLQNMRDNDCHFPKRKENNYNSSSWGVILSHQIVAG